MCGIFGSNDIETFRKLYTKNIDRGNFVRSVTMLFPAGVKSNTNITTVYELDLDKKIPESKYCVYYLGHVQSPTSSVREFDVKTSHPYKLNNQYLAHNGVLENDRELIDEMKLENYNDVDSSIILPLIDKAGFVEGIEMLQGTFGCWYYNASDATLKIFRSGSTLFIDHKYSSFTSASQTGYKLVNEGEILEYNFTNRKFYKSNTFKLNSVPFFL